MASRNNTPNLQEAFSDEMPILVDFFGPQCGSCQTMEPIITNLEAKYRSAIRFIAINVEENPLIAAAFHVRSVPTLLLFRKGEIHWRKSGLIAKKDLEVLLRNEL